MKTNKEISLEEQYAILLKYCEKKLGYKKTHEFLETAFESYSPVEYAIKKAEQILEKR